MVVVERNGKNTQKTVVCKVGKSLVVAIPRRNDLLCNTVAAMVINSVSIFWHGVKVDRPPEVTPVQRACAYVDRRSGRLVVVDRHTGEKDVELTATYHVTYPTCDFIA